MKRTQRIVDRFPHFFMTWDNNSTIYNIVSAMGKRLDEYDREITSIMRSHWVDKAYKSDLDKIGALYNIRRTNNESDDEYRNRLKRAILEYKGGGTINAILTSLKMSLGLSDDNSIEIIENPPLKLHKEFRVVPGETWKFSSESIHDVRPTIELSIESGAESVSNPLIKNIDTGEEISYKDEIITGEILKIGEDYATLNNKNVKKKISTTQTPIIPRKMTTWTYTEPISKEIGVFDTAVFNESKFAIGISVVKIGFDWTAHQPATFEIKISEKQISSPIRKLLVESTIENIKATGVRAIITPIEGK